MLGRVSIEAQGFGVIPDRVRRVLNDFSACEEGKRKTKWWEGERGIKAVSLTAEGLEAYGPQVLGLVGDPAVLQAGEFRMAEADLEFTARNLTLNMGGSSHGDVRGNKFMLSLGGKILRGKEFGYYIRKTSVRSEHLAYFPDHNTYLALGLVTWAGGQNLTKICDREWQKSREVNRELFPWVYGLVNLVTPDYQP